MSIVSKQELEIPLNLGMSTKPSAELQEPSEMRLVENLHWRGLGEIEMVPADDVSHLISEPAGSAYDESGACGLVLRENDPVVVTGKHGVMTYSERLGIPQFARRDIILSGTPDAGLKYCPAAYDVSRRFVERVQNSREQLGIFSVAAAKHNGVHVFAWFVLGSVSELRVKAIDGATGTVLATAEFSTIGSLGFTGLKACEYTEPGAEGVLIAYANDPSPPYTIRAIRYDRATNEFVSAGTLTTNAAFTRFALAKNSNRVYLAFTDHTSTFLTVQDRTIGSVSTTHTATHSGAFGVAVLVAATRTLIVSTDGAQTYAEVFGAPANVQTPVPSAGNAFVSCTAAIEDVIGGGNSAAFWVNEVGASSGVRVRSAQITFDTTTPSTLETAQISNSWVPAAAFTLHGLAHVPVVPVPLASGVPSSCYVLRRRNHSSGALRHDPVAKLCHGRFHVPFTVETYEVMSCSFADGTNAWVAMMADAPAAGISLPQTIFQSRLEAVRPMPMPYASPEPRVVFVAGGVPWEFDGDTPAEASPLAYPRPTVDVSSGTGQTGTFGVRVIWRWVDAAGRLHRIAGPVVVFTCSNKRIDISVPACPFTAYDGLTAPRLDTELYMTQPNGTEFLLCGNSLGNKLTTNTLSADFQRWIYSDVKPSELLATSQAIFSSEIPPEPPPAFLHVARVADRLVAIDAEDRARVWFSKPLVDGYGVEWSTACTFRIGDEGTAVVDAQGGIAILARNGVYLVAGGGPDLTIASLANTFSPAVKISGECDCIDPASVCRTPLGVVFRGRRGFYVLNGMAVQPFGVPIDPEVLTNPELDPDVSAANRMRVVWQEQTNEIHVSAPGGPLIYNVLEQKWSTRSGKGTRDLVVARGKLWRLDRVAGADYLRSEKLFSQAGADYNEVSEEFWRIETPWLKPDDVGGTVRLWRAWLSVALPGNAEALERIALYYYTDFGSTPVQEVEWTGSELKALYDGGERVVSLPFYPSQGVCKAFRFGIEQAVIGATSGAKPLSLRLLFGVRGSKGKRLRAAVR